MSSYLRVATFLFVLITAIGFSGCSSFHPFGREKSEDLNLLTYGEHYENGKSRDGSWSSLSDQETAFKSQTNSRSENASGRSSANREMASESSKNGDQSANKDDRQDAADDSVRQDVEKSRGYNAKNGSFSRGDRATKSDFYDDAPNDGSLWANENDANYFFTKGKVRTAGDIISVKLEEPMIRQFAEEIKKTLTPAEQEVEMALYRKNEVAAKGDQDLKAYRNIASEDLKSSEAEEVKERMEKAVRWSQVDLTKVVGFTPNEELRAEILDHYQNGNYKVRAVKRVLYRGSSKLVSIVAVAPATDFDDKDLIPSGKLYEYKIKVVH